MKRAVVLVVLCLLVVLLGVVAASTRAAAQGFSLLPVVTNLPNPVGVVNAGDGSGRLFIVLQGGRIVIYTGTSVLTTDFLNITSRVTCCGERGLLGLVFHPDYPTTPYFYVNYINTSGNTVIARYAVSGDPNVATFSSEKIILTLIQPAFTNHKAGDLHFGPDGYLYFGTGDGGSGGDPDNRAQNLADPLGKVLRIDVNVPDTAVPPYAIPPDNPFVSSPPGARPEIWAYGLRNPWRISFDRLTGDLFIADVGQGAREEVNFQPAGTPGGRSYGWRIMEGTVCFNPSSGCNPAGITLPVLEYDHSLGCSITGGYRYRGTQVPSLTALYIYGDFCSGRIWGATQTGPASFSTVQLMDTALNISTFGEDEAGELYVVHLNAVDGVVYRLVPTGDTTAPDTTMTGGPSGTITTGDATFTWTGADDVTPTGSLVYATRLEPIEAGFGAFGSATSRSFSGLANGAYIFHVRARDQANNEDPSPAMRSFTVNVTTVPGEIIIDNAAAGVQDPAGGRTFTGTWCLSLATNSFGANSLYSCGTSADTYRFTPNILSFATYDVYVWWSTHPNRSTNVPILVAHAGGTTTRNFNERSPGGVWVLHGRYTLNQGTSGHVQVSAANGQAAADAARFVPVPGAPPPSVAISATDATATEAGPTTGQFTVTRSGSTAAALTVVYSVVGSATPGTDYATLPGSVTIPVGASSAPITVTPISDGTAEGDETVVVTLSANAAYTVGAPDNATVTIVNAPGGEIILDNAPVGTQGGGRSFTGTWCVSGAVDFFGPDSLYSCGGGLETYRFIPTISPAGTYDVYVRWSSHPNRSTTVPIAVVHTAGTTVRTFNQRVSSGGFMLHGRYGFSDGAAGYVEVSDVNGQASADAVRFVPAGPASNPVPGVSALSPDRAPAGGPGFTLTVTGTNFVGTSVVRWNGSDRPTTVVDASQVQAAIAAADLTGAGSAQVTVFTGAPGGGTSNGVPFTIDPAASTEIIIDNAAAGAQDATRSFTGSWCLTPASNQFGATALQNCFGAVAATYRWTPTMPTAGAWDVYIWWGAQANQSTAALVTVVGADGSFPRTFNQRTGGGQWVLHGRYNFTAGSGGYVQASNTAGGAHVAADAVRFVRAP